MHCVDGVGFGFFLDIGMEELFLFGFEDRTFLILGGY